MILKNSIIIIVILCFISTGNTQQMDKNSEKLINNLLSINGGYKHLASKKDV